MYIKHCSLAKSGNNLNMDCISFLLLLYQITTTQQLFTMQVYYLIVLQARSLKMGSIALKSRCQQGCSFLWRLQEGAWFSFPRGCCVPWLVASSSIFKASSVPSSSPSLTLTLLSPSYKELINIGSTQVIQYILTISRFLLSSAEPLLPCKVTYSRLQGMDIFGGALFCLPCRSTVEQVN